MKYRLTRTQAYELNAIFAPLDGILVDKAVYFQRQTGINLILGTQKNIRASLYNYAKNRILNENSRYERKMHQLTVEQQNFDGINFNVMNEIYNLTTDWIQENLSDLLDFINKEAVTIERQRMTFNEFIRGVLGHDWSNGFDFQPLVLMKTGRVKYINQFILDERQLNGIVKIYDSLTALKEFCRTYGRDHGLVMNMLNDISDDRELSLQKLHNAIENLNEAKAK